MCTGITYKHYFGRTLDVKGSYDEVITITPRYYTFVFKEVNHMKSHYAMIGIAKIIDDYPLYFDATNEKGLSMAGLRFTEARYKNYQRSMDNITPFEFIPWILGQCSCVEEAKILLKRMNLVNLPFNEQIPLAPLHWIISDQGQSITVECLESGLKVYDNDIGVMTNDPVFNIQRFILNNYMHISRENPKNTFSDKIQLKAYSMGMGGLGLPGDTSSLSRFVRATYTKLNSVCMDNEYDEINQFFHILGSVKQIKGCVLVGKDYEITRYTSCCNMKKCIYYYTSYDNQQIIGIDMYKENIDSCQLITYPLLKPQKVFMQNA